jgi:M6 family metalloprotease-like protein
MIASSYAHYINDIKVHLSQPDGTNINCFSEGNHFYVRLYDKNNYTIMQSDIDGFYYYATIIEDKLTPSKFLANESLPYNSGIKPGLQISRDNYLKRISKKSVGRGRDAPTIGTINNINIFIRFADETEFATPRSIMDEPFNKPEGPSMSHYYDEVSYSQLEVITHHFPSCEMNTNLSYQDQFPRSYYQPYNAQTNTNGYTESNSTIREHTLLKNAIEFISQEIPLTLDIDGNNDGYVDNVTFLVSGSPDGWSDLLWPHRWSLYSFDVWINGSIVDAYNLNLATGGYFTVGTLCHEFFHSLGAPDLYHYTDTGSPTSTGAWDVMDASSDIPQYMGAWMKHKYGNWIECPTINQLGIYPLLPLQYQESSCYRIDSPNSNNEFFIVEYRDKDGIYEINTPGSNSGMLVYRINENLNGNANGPPDEVYLYRPGGTSSDNGNLTEAVFSLETGRTKINDNTDPSSFLYDSSPGGLNIQDIGTAGDIIEFTYWNIFMDTEIINVIDDDDGDGVLNPGETATINLSANILSSPSNAYDVLATLSSSLEWINFNPNEIIFGTILNNGISSEAQTQIILSDINSLQPATFNIDIEGTFLDNGIEIEYFDQFEYQLDITLNQKGFPINSSEIRSNALVIDLNNDGYNEIIFGDYSGVIHIFNSDGTEVINDNFPFNTGDQIWGSAASADMDRDGYLEFVIPSKNKHLYIFDYNGLKLDYETSMYLIGSPAIGNIDNDDDLEIIFSGYSSNNKIFAINIDGSNVEGFPFDLGEKTKAGPALADLNGNNLDDIIIGTDNNNLYLIYDNATIAPGFPFLANNKFQVSPSIINFNNTNYIFAGNNDNNLYVVNTDGSLNFSFPTSDRIISSTSFTQIDNIVYSFFASRNDSVYAINLEGENLTGWPKYFDGNMEGEVIFADLNNNQSQEIIIATESGKLFALELNGDSYKYFPINNNLPYTGPPMIIDLDMDNDLEILAGALNSFNAIDLKDIAQNNNNYWSIFRGNNKRTGYYQIIQESCTQEYGDVNGDTYINILDLVQIANYILEVSTPNFICAADFNQDNIINILDLVQIANYIIDN